MRKRIPYASAISQGFHGDTGWREQSTSKHTTHCQDHTAAAWAPVKQ
jgi:hypothetical protein